MLQLVIPGVSWHIEREQKTAERGRGDICSVCQCCFALVKEGAECSLEREFLGSSRHVDVDSLAVMPKDEHFTKYS